MQTDLRTIILKIDELDYQAIQAAIAERQRSSLPDTGHDDANAAGRNIAEICRGWLEMLGLWGMPGTNDEETPHD